MRACVVRRENKRRYSTQVSFKLLYMSCYWKSLEKDQRKLASSRWLTPQGYGGESTSLCPRAAPSHLIPLALNTLLQLSHQICLMPTMTTINEPCRGKKMSNSVPHVAHFSACTLRATNTAHALNQSQWRAHSIVQHVGWDNGVLKTMGKGHELAWLQAMAVHAMHRDLLLLHACKQFRASDTLSCE